MIYNSKVNKGSTSGVSKTIKQQVGLCKGPNVTENARAKQACLLPTDYRLQTIVSYS